MGADSKTFRQLLDQHQQDATRPGSSAAWQHACEAIWDFLSTGINAAVPDEDLELFTRLLHDEDRFCLAKMVIPALREEAEAARCDNIAQQQIIRTTQTLRSSIEQRETATQAEFDDPLYLAEKRVLMDAEMHRARVLLHQSGAFGSASEELIRQWLARHPDMMGSEQPK